MFKRYKKSGLVTWVVISLTLLALMPVYAVINASLRWGGNLLVKTTDGFNSLLKARDSDERSRVIENLKNLTKSKEHWLGSARDLFKVEVDSDLDSCPHE